MGGLVLVLGREKATRDDLRHRHGRVPHQEAGHRQHLVQQPEQALQILAVASPEVPAIPREVPEAGVHNDQVRVMRAPLQLFQDLHHVLGVHAREEVEAHKMVARAELADLSVVRAIVHATPPAALQQHILLKTQLTLGLQLSG